MSEGTAERPVLWGTVGPPATFERPVGGGSKVDIPTRQSQAARLGTRFAGLDDAFSEQVLLSQSLGAHEPQLVIVFEAIDEREDLSAAARRAGLEILTEVDLDFQPDAQFPRKSRDKSLPVGGCLHAICINEQAKAKVLAQWRKWQRNERLDTGYGALGRLFAHLKDVRPWGPSDRVRLANINEALQGLLPGSHSVEVELWYRQSEEARARAEAEVTALLTREGGQVITSAQVAEVGYHGMKCKVPLGELQRLASGDYDAIAAVRSAHVMYLRVTSQSHTFSEEVPPLTTNALGPPQGDPVLCVLDGAPVANHPRLSGHVIVVDSDDLAANTASSTDLRRHGTAMASVCVWGDLSADNLPARRPVLVRPILTPASDTADKNEEVPGNTLAPDLMRRIFRELFDGEGTTAAAAPTVVVLNISVGDPAAPFDGVMSSWARTLDWLSAEYGVVVVVSAGNHPALDVPQGAQSLTTVNGPGRAEAVNTAVAEATPRRSLLSPAESINALSVGALDSDAAEAVPVGPYQVDPADGELIVSPTSALGSGYRRSIKPDLVAPGGRSRFTLPIVTTTATALVPAPQTTRGPGIRVAAPKGGEAFIRGTSPAAALVSRAAARAVDTVLGLAGRNLTRSELAVATKALVAHGARIPSELIVHNALRHAAHGYGALARDLSDGCQSNEAAILFVGSIGEEESRTLSFPLPDGLQSQGTKRITATLAWMSPTNWRHRQYRRAALEFSKPKGFTTLGSAVGAPGNKPKRGTLQHVEWEVERSVGVGVGSTMDLTVNCSGQAGGLRGERVDFGVVLTLWVAPELGIDVYTQVRQQVEGRVVVQTPTGAS